MKYYLMKAEGTYPTAVWKTERGDSHLLDDALAYTEAQIANDPELNNRACWIPVRCDVAERLAKRMVKRHEHLRHLGLVADKPSREQNEAVAWLDEQDPGVKVLTHALPAPLDMGRGHTVSWITTTEPITIGAVAGTTREMALRAFQARAVAAIASAMAMRMLELTDAEWVVVRRALSRLTSANEDPLYVGLQMYVAGVNSTGELRAKQGRCLHLNRPASYCSCPDCGAPPSETR